MFGASNLMWFALYCMTRRLPMPLFRLGLTSRCSAPVVLRECRVLALWFADMLVRVVDGDCSFGDESRPMSLNIAVDDARE